MQVSGITNVISSFDSRHDRAGCLFMWIGCLGNRKQQGRIPLEE
jgi:hypothetical protein